ncbi:MAG: hypothetical protein HYV60_05785, partial [Planctomycetia bacterium]|nr:hypothetical protein [Planctomycetia bacterium]
SLACPVGAQPSAPTNRAEIVEVEDAVKRFDTTAKEISQARKQLAQPHPAFAKFAEAVKGYRANPNDNGAAATYAEAFAVSVQVMKDRLTRFVELKEQAEQDFQAFSTVAQAGKDAFQRQRDQSQQSAASYEAAVADWEGKLDQLANQYTQVLQNGEELPDEVGQFVERADIQLAQASTKAALFKGFAARAEGSIAKTDSSLRAAQHWFHRVGLHFLHAEGNSEILDLIAAAGSQQLDSPLPNVALEVAKLDPIDEPPILGDLIRGLTESLGETPAKTGHTDSETAKSTAGSKILLRRLNKPRETANAVIGGQ